MSKKLKRIISFLLIGIMIFTMVPEIPVQAALTKGANLVPTVESNGQITFYYQGNGTEQEVYVKGSWDSNWSKYFYMAKTENDFWSVTSEGLDAGKSYEYGIVVDGTWLSPQPNASASGSNPRIIRNPNVNADGTVTFYYYPSMGEDASNIKVKYQNAEETTGEAAFAADADYPTIYSATTTPLNGSYTYCISVSDNDLANYNSDTNTFTASSAPEENPDIKSPVIDGGNVTFYYYGPTAKEVKLAGNMTNWGDGAKSMTYDGTTGYWSILLEEQKSGDYQYKFIMDGSWIVDPLNNENVSGNSAYTVTDGYVPELVSPVVNTSQVTFYYQGDATDTVVLAGSMNGWKSDGNDADYMTSYDEVTGLWSLTKRLAPGKYEYKLVVNGNWITDPLNINPMENGNNVVEVSDYYTYNIYYYDTKHKELKDSCLWIWEDGGQGGQEHYFTSQETIDGYTWLKAEVDLAYTKIGVIPKNYSTNQSWEWQDATRMYEFTGDNPVENMYLVYGDATAYTECPDLSSIEMPKDRYVIIDYTREKGDYEGWNIYTWNSGYGSEVTVPFENVNGKWTAVIPVSPSTAQLSFCVRRSEAGSPWAEKDGGDHSVNVPLDQTVVKARFVQEEGVTETLPYNKGFEIVPDKGLVKFYYRDDSRFLNGTLAELAGKVKICIGTSNSNARLKSNNVFDMVYDQETERFVYTYNSLAAGIHTYYYLVDGEKILDPYNTRTNEGGDANVYEYQKFNAQIEASMEYPSMDYNDNNLLRLSIQTEEGVAEKIEVVEAYADLSQLGGGTVSICPELMELSISVLHTTAPGTKLIPVTVKDQYGNLYSGQATVEVKDRDSGDGDFDWDESVIYFTVTDRFFDGNNSNNDAYGIGDYNTGTGGNLSYHGGDFAGLVQKLDYLQELGINTIWITPIVENYMADGLTTTDPGIKSYGYHGYWTSDFEKLNKHLGTEEEFSELVEELHNRDMKLMVDVVLNHSGYDTDGNNITDFFNSKIPGKKMLRDNTTTVPGSEVLDSLAGLPDFVTEDAEVRELLIQWQTSWVAKYDIDYFRVDTVKHVEDVTWSAFKNALTIIDPEFKMIGEQAGAGYATSAGKLRSGAMDSLLDFDFNDKALDFVYGKLSEVESFMQKRNEGMDNTATLGNFLGSHDEDGLMYRMQTEGNMGQEESFNAMKLAASLQMTAKGQPVIYYGEEVGQTGANNYPIQSNRYDFDWELVNEDNTMLAHYKTLLEIRNEYSDVFAKGNRTGVTVSDEKGYDVFSRSYQDTTLLVALQNGTEEQSVSVTAGQPGDTLLDVYNDTSYKVGEDGSASIVIPSAADGGTAILELVKKETEKPDKEKPDKEKPDTEKPDTEKPDTEKPDNGNNNSQKSNTGKTEGNKVDKTKLKSPSTYDSSIIPGNGKIQGDYNTIDTGQNSILAKETKLLIILAIVTIAAISAGVKIYTLYLHKESEE